MGRKGGALEQVKLRALDTFLYNKFWLGAWAMPCSSTPDWFAKRHAALTWLLEDSWKAVRWYTVRTSGACAAQIAAGQVAWKLWKNFKCRYASREVVGHGPLNPARPFV